ncbi:MAG: hypothetical protein C0597_01040, partial [Marinilabiliales bacterium]
MKNLKMYFILIVLIIIAGIFYFSNNKGTLNLRNASFAVSSQDDITRIELLADEKSLILEKESNQWKANNKYRATNDYVENLTLALSRITVLSPVSETEKEQVATILRKDGILV